MTGKHSKKFGPWSEFEMNRESVMADTKGHLPKIFSDILRDESNVTKWREILQDLLDECNNEIEAVKVNYAQRRYIAAKQKSTLMHEQCTSWYVARKREFTKEFEAIQKRLDESKKIVDDLRKLKRKNFTAEKCLSGGEVSMSEIKEYMAAIRQAVKLLMLSERFVPVESVEWRTGFGEFMCWSDSLIPEGVSVMSDNFGNLKSGGN
jgi:hypothetical protein